MAKSTKQIIEWLQTQIEFGGGNFYVPAKVVSSGAQEFAETGQSEIIKNYKAWRYLKMFFDYESNPKRINIDQLREYQRLCLLRGVEVEASIKAILLEKIAREQALKEHYKVRIGFSAKIKLAVIERDGYICQKCGAQEWLEVDHIKEVIDGGTNDLENLQILCQGCHKDKTAESRKLRNQK